MNLKSFFKEINVINNDYPIMKMDYNKKLNKLVVLSPNNSYITFYKLDNKELIYIESFKILEKTISQNIFSIKLFDKFTFIFYLNGDISVFNNNTKKINTINLSFNKESSFNFTNDNDYLYLSFDKKIVKINVETLEVSDFIINKESCSFVNIFKLNGEIYIAREHTEEYIDKKRNRSFIQKYDLINSAQKVIFKSDCYITCGSSNNEYNFIGLSNNTVQIYDREFKKIINVIDLNKNRNIITLKSDLFYLYIGSEDGDLTVYDIKDGNIIYCLNDLVQDYVHDILIVNPELFIVGGYNSKIRLLERKLKPVLFGNNNLRYNNNMYLYINYKFFHGEKYEKMTLTIYEENNENNIIFKKENVLPNSELIKRIVFSANMLKNFNNDIIIELKDLIGNKVQEKVKVKYIETFSMSNSLNTIHFIYRGIGSINKIYTKVKFYKDDRNIDESNVYEIKPERFIKFFKFEGLDIKDNNIQYEVLFSDTNDFNNYISSGKYDYIDSKMHFNIDPKEIDYNGGFSLLEKFSINNIFTNTYNKKSLSDLLNFTSNPVDTSFNNFVRDFSSNSIFDRYGNKLSYLPNERKIEIPFNLKKYERNDKNKVIYEDDNVTNKLKKNEEIYASDNHFIDLYIDGKKVFDNCKKDIISRDGSFSTIVNEIVLFEDMIERIENSDLDKEKDNKITKNYSVYSYKIKSDYEIVEYKLDNKLTTHSVLSNKNKDGKYERLTIIIYKDNKDVSNIISYNLSYDENGELINKNIVNDIDEYVTDMLNNGIDSYIKNNIEEKLPIVIHSNNDTIIEYLNHDKTKYMISKLFDKDENGNYTKCETIVYNSDSTIKSNTIYSLKYDSDGNIIDKLIIKNIDSGVNQHLNELINCNPVIRSELNNELIEYKNSKGAIFMTSLLSDKDPNNLYKNCTITEYNDKGDIKRKTIYNLEYDKAGFIISKNIIKDTKPHVDEFKIDNNKEYEVLLDSNIKIEAVLMRRDIIDSEHILENIQIQNEKDIENLYSGEFKIRFNSLGNITKNDLDVYIKFRHSYYYNRIDPKSLSMKINKKENYISIKITDSILLKKIQQLTLVTKDIDKNISYELIKDEESNSKKFYYVPIIKTLPDGSLVTHYTDDINDFRVVVNGYTLTPNVDYTLINSYLHDQIPSIILFKEPVLEGSNVEINFIETKKDTTYYFNNNEYGIYHIYDDNCFFLEGTFEVFKGNKKLTKDEYEIISKKIIRIKEAPFDNVYIKFFYINDEKIDDIVTILSEDDSEYEDEICSYGFEHFVNNYISKNNIFIDKDKIDKDIYKHDSDIDLIGRIYLLLWFVDKNFNNSQDAVIDCNLEDSVPFVTNLNPNIMYDLNYINNDLDFNCTLDYNKEDFK